MYYQMYRKNVSDTLDAIFETQEQKLHEAGMVLAQVLVPALEVGLLEMVRHRRRRRFRRLWRA